MSELGKAIQFDALTGQVTERELTADEIEFHESIVSQSLANEQAIAAKDEARTSALAKLAALGLTEEEIAAL
jgi:hypothetical protein